MLGIKFVVFILNAYNEIWRIWSKRVIWKLEYFQSLLTSKIAQLFLRSNFYKSNFFDLDDKDRTHYLIRKGINRKFKEIDNGEKDIMRKDLDSYKE